MVPNKATGRCEFDVVENEDITFNPDLGTVRQGDALCPFTGTTAPVDYVRGEYQAGRTSQQLMAVVSVLPGRQGKLYRAVTKEDDDDFRQASEALAALKSTCGDDIVPQEPISKRQPRVMWVTTYGVSKWSWLFNDRQLLALVTLARLVQEAGELLGTLHAPDYAKALATFLGVALSRFSDFNSSLCTFNYTGGRGVKNSFARQALPMVWDYAESAPFNPQGANWQACVDAAVETISRVNMPMPGLVLRGTATAIPVETATQSAVVTDPPYYDAVPYADLSDFFYVWMKRAVAKHNPDVFRTPVTPKRQELTEERPHTSLKDRKDSRFYEAGMGQAFKEMCRTLLDNGICCVMFAHKTTAAWEALIAGLLNSGMTVTASWPFRTERPGRMTAQSVAALASSVTLVCRKRDAKAGVALWDDVRHQLQSVASERLDFFWSQGIRGADFFISAIGPALSVFGKYERVTKLSGEEVTVGQFLDEVRSHVTGYALTKILRTRHTGSIDPESRFYVVWKWSYGDAKVPADESFKLSQALRLDSASLWDRTGVLEKAGENVLAAPITKRMKIKNLGEPGTTGSPASLIDVLHRLCTFREKGDTQGMAQFLGRSGHANNHSLWLIAQAISEILPDGEKEKQLMQGLLNQKEGLMEATRQGELF
jgi:adenine-specific DNA methylase